LTDAEVNTADVTGANLTGAKLKTGSEEVSKEGEGPLAKVPVIRDFRKDQSLEVRQPLILFRFFTRKRMLRAFNIINYLIYW
jgi:hypothetical protein